MNIVKVKFQQEDIRVNGYKIIKIINIYLHSELRMHTHGLLFFVGGRGGIDEGRERFFFFSFVQNF